MVQDVVGEFVPGGLENNALEVIRVDISVPVFVENVEGLSDPLALDTSQHLGKLRVGHVVACLGPSGVQRSPFRVPVKRYSIAGFIDLVEAFESLELDGARAIEVEETERDLILGVRFCQQGLEGGPVGETQSAGFPPIRHVEQDFVLFSLDFVLSH